MFVSACGLDIGDETFTTPEFYIFDELDDLNYARALVRSDATPAVLNAASYYSGCHMLVLTTGDSLSGTSAPADFRTPNQFKSVMKWMSRR